MTVAAAQLPARFARLVKLEHTVFALPFAYTGAFLAVGGVPSAHDIVWITIAMVGARTLAMGLNRLIDAELDARNPRTSGRELPAGLLRRRSRPIRMRSCVSGLNQKPVAALIVARWPAVVGRSVLGCPGVPAAWVTASPGPRLNVALS